MPKTSSRKIVLVISSHVIRGAVGSRVSVYALENSGYPVWSLLTVSLTWQPRHGKAHKLIPSEEDFAAWVRDILGSSWRHEIDAVLTGYFGSAAQVAITAELVTVLQKEKPELVVMCDPIIGNEDGLYVDSTIAEAIRDRLLPLATLIKPNRNELEWFCGRQFTNNEEIVEAARTFSPALLLVSSAFPCLSGNTGNLLVAGENIWLAEHPRFTTPVNGLGDLLGAMFLVHTMDGHPLEQALQQATATVYEYLHYTLRIGANELALADAPLTLKHPHAPVTLRQIASRLQSGSGKKVGQND